MRKTGYLALFLLILAGCAPEEQQPVIVYEPSVTPIPKTPSASPAVVKPTLPSSAPTNNQIPAGWIPAKKDRAWTAIVIHHSATNEGDAATFDKWHREGKGWNGVGYDFVIGNGTYSGDGQVEPTHRWRGQLTGAHVGGTDGNWANEEGIGICLVGDFNIYAPTVKQRESLVKLVRFLQKRYCIPKSRIYGHSTTPGAHATDCPGRRFPMAWLKSAIPD